MFSLFTKNISFQFSREKYLQIFTKTKIIKRIYSKRSQNLFTGSIRKSYISLERFRCNWLNDVRFFRLLCFRFSFFPFSVSFRSRLCVRPDWMWTIGMTKKCCGAWVIFWFPFLRAREITNVTQKWNIKMLKPDGTKNVSVNSRSNKRKQIDKQFIECEEWGVETQSTRSFLLCLVHSMCMCKCLCERTSVCACEWAHIVSSNQIKHA